MRVKDARRSGGNKTILIGGEVNRYFTLSDEKDLIGIPQTFAGTGRGICWTAGGPPANAPQARNLSEATPNSFSRFALICGRDARGPSKALEWGTSQPAVVERGYCPKYNSSLYPVSVNH